MEIINPGNTAAKFSFLFPADFRIELEGWARHADLTHDQFEILKIEENKLFQIEPRHGVLQRGERKIIKMTYQHKMIGKHALPVVMSISGGRQIPLRLAGITLSQDDLCLAFPSEHYELRPVQLGLLQAPMQKVSFYNGSALKIHYEIDLDSVRQLNAANWDWDILTIINPKGVVEPNSCGEIQMAFLPLEAREYNIALSVRIKGGPDQTIRIRGRGMDPSRPISSLSNEAFLENTTKVEEPEQQYALSQDRVKLGSVPMGSPVRRIIFLENRSNNNAALFQWKFTNNRFLSIKPQSGQIEPGGQQLITIEYFVPVDSEPAFHNIESCCEIISVDRVRRYMSNLTSWKKEHQRQEEEFTIDDSIHQPRQVRLIESAGDLRVCSPYSKLPPLSPRKSSKRGQEPIWIKPRPPLPERLQLTVSAESLTRPEFLDKFPAEFPHFFSNSSTLSNSKKEEQSAVVECSDEEARTMRTIVGNVVRTLLDDQYMQEILKDQINEEPCYFAQFDGANWPPVKPEEPKPSKNRLIASIMAMEDSTCPPTPVNSTEEATPDQTTDQMEDLLLVENIMSGIIENIVSEAASFETILTAKPLNIVQKH